MDYLAYLDKAIATYDGDPPSNDYQHGHLNALIVARAELAGLPIPMLLFCPACGLQHLDEPNEAEGWTNPPHRSHKCHHCGCIWRPADVPTTGVLVIETDGTADTWDPAVSIGGYRIGEPPICEGCSKPVLRGQFVHHYDDVGEVHVDCDHPFAVPAAPTLDDDNKPMPEYLLLGQPLQLVAAPKVPA